MAQNGPPGTEQPRRYRPKLRYELLGCGLHGHELVGTDAAELREQDALFARESGELRWFRCMRCDSWLPLPRPEPPARQFPPDREDVALPLRGRALRDRYVLRLIALDRVVHFVILVALAIAIFVFVGHRTALQHDYVKILNAIEGGTAGHPAGHSWLDDLQRAFDVSPSRLTLVAWVLVAYAALEGSEAVGLWLGKRWAEYLTFIATVVLLPLEVFELTERVSVTKVITFVINLAIAVYLLLSKRLFGLRGGGKAAAAEHDADIGWAAIERSTPGTEVVPT